LYDGLQALEADLHEHIHLENNILFPKSIKLEEVMFRY
jgi:regulator of cell morphogenesis and NO signaling